MLISYIAALLPLTAMWLVFRKLFAEAKVLLYAEQNQGTPAEGRNYSYIKRQKPAASPSPLRDYN
jgi:hypothetical protein